MHTTPNTGNVNVSVSDDQNDRYRCESVHWSPLKMPHSVVANRFFSSSTEKPHTNVVVHQWQGGSRPVKVTAFEDRSCSAPTLGLSLDTIDENGHYACTIVHLPIAMIDTLREALDSSRVVASDPEDDDDGDDFTEREYRNERNRFTGV
jgi:hypothetical protein